MLKNSRLFAKAIIAVGVILILDGFVGIIVSVIYVRGLPLIAAIAFDILFAVIGFRLWEIGKDKIKVIEYREQEEKEALKSASLNRSR